MTLLINDDFVVDQINYMHMNAFFSPLYTKFNQLLGNAL